MKKLQNSKNSYTVGLDEVGRGALAGPVVVVAAGVIANRKSRVANRQLGKLKDSKKLSPKQREAWFVHFKNHPEVFYAIARVYPRRIEKMNISQAANLAAHRAYKALIAQRPFGGFGATKSLIADHAVYLDGGLYLKNRNWQNRNHPRAQTLIKADEKIAAVAVASIIAKVLRDRAMTRLGRKWPPYGFEIHKGYGTKNHYVALLKYGHSKAHRLTFLTKKSILRK